MAFNRLSELRSLPFVNSQRFTRTSELLSEIDGRPQGIIIECRCTEIGLAGRESALQFIGIGSDDPFGSEFAPAVFETPFHQRPQLFGFVPFPAGQGVARSAVCDHRGIASIAGPVPDVVALGDDRTRNRPVFSIHETGEVAECVECRSIPDVVSEHWEKRVDVFGLIVGPNSRVVTFAARSMHVAAAGLDNAFGSPDLGKAEFRVDYRIRGLQDQFVRDCRHELPTRAEFGSDICGRKCLSDSTSPEEGIHHGRISGLQYADSGIEQFGPNDVAARNASLRRGRHDLRKLWDGNLQRLRTDVADKIPFTEGGLCRRRKDRALHGQDRSRMLHLLVSGPHGIKTPLTKDPDRTVYDDLFDPFELQGRSIETRGGGIHGQQRGNIRGHAAHQTGMRIIGTDT